MAIGLLTLALFGTASLLATILFGHLAAFDPAGVKRHFLAALGTTTILLLAHSAIMFFLIATGVELKELEKQRGWGDSFRRRTLGMKSKVFPVTSLALLLVMASFVLGAAAHTRALPGWVHGLVAWSTLAVCVLALARQYRALGDNNRLIGEASRRRTEGTAPRP